MTDVQRIEPPAMFEIPDELYSSGKQHGVRGRDEPGIGRRSDSCSARYEAIMFLGAS